MIFETIENSNTFITTSILDNNKVCESKVSINTKTNTWTISAWYTADNYMHKGFGKKTLAANLKAIYDKFGKPSKVEYIWNGTNQYVMDWLSRNFDPVSSLPLAVMKYQEADCWEAHVYLLNTEKVLNFMEREAA